MPWRGSLAAVAHPSILAQQEEDCGGDLNPSRWFFRTFWRLSTTVMAHCGVDGDGRGSQPIDGNAKRLVGVASFSQPITIIFVQVPFVQILSQALVNERCRCDLLWPIPFGCVHHRGFIEALSAIDNTVSYLCTSS